MVCKQREISSIGRELLTQGFKISGTRVKKFNKDDGKMTQKETSCSTIENKNDQEILSETKVQFGDNNKIKVFKRHKVSIPTVEVQSDEDNLDFEMTL